MGLSFYPSVHGALLDAGLVASIVLAVGGSAMPRYVSCCAGLAICNLHRHPGCAVLLETARGHHTVSLHHTVADTARCNTGMPPTGVDGPSVNCKRPAHP